MIVLNNIRIKIIIFYFLGCNLESENGSLSFLYSISFNSAFKDSFLYLPIFQLILNSRDSNLKQKSFLRIRVQLRNLDLIGCFI